MVDINNMSELQISLIAIGIVVVMAVLLFNWMQQRRYRRSAEQAFGQKPEDVLLRPDMSVGTSAEEGERIEPQLGKEPRLNFRRILASCLGSGGTRGGSPTRTATQEPPGQV